MSLTLSQNNINLGNLRLGQPKSFSVLLENNTAQDIPISKIVVGCGNCTAAKVNVNTIKANSKEPINIVFTPKSTGINRKSVTINNSLILTFVATVN